MLENLQHGLIVSCQAPVGSPLHDPSIVAAMAQAAVIGGAKGVRVDTPAHVRATREKLPDTPIIGLWKQHVPGSEVYITPHFEDARAIADAGADIIAIDATLRDRGNADTLQTLIPRIGDELGKLVMADADSIEGAIAAAQAGADCVGTTLYGYTSQTQHLSPPGWDLLQQLVEQLEIPAICEGGIASPDMAETALQLGAHAVVVGGAITGIDLKIQAFQAVFPQSRRI
ncbi:N-acetylmannosamine-6-phosphate 2-epimerase [Lusitaniella coriacea LEGE 07157]|uniref:Putative N-acetylmannosamine-6-phosphate 2-epimerase n=1 Tax=Lusitaniella coriacea LEGE 07157 TaxID=945747 RepID=A0A8J7ARU1_9CYAN|nr:N-acetylmannosamine-6-phosphate 2-epimerase [Lusitaniella coriacea LEGE 07157]